MPVVEALPPEALDRRLAVAAETARAAGDLLLERFRVPATGAVEYKGARDIVTEADRASERLIVDRLQAAFPDDAVVAEEGTNAPGPSGGRWIVDPLDGTVNFAHRYPHFAVSIGYERAGRIEVGVVRNPVRDETFAVRRGAPPPPWAIPLGATATASLDRAMILTGFGMLRGSSPDPRTFEILRRALLATEGIRRAGSAALDLAYVASGRADGFYEWGLRPWDVAAGGLLVEAAGGIVTAVDGGRNWLESGGIVAANARVHAALLDVVRA